MSLVASNLTLLPNKYPHQRTRELSQEASISDGNSSGTETDRTPRAISTSSFPSTSPSNDPINTSPASFSSSSTITGRTPRIRVSTTHRRGQSDATFLSNLQPLIIATSLEPSTRPTSEIYGSFSTTPRRRGHGRSPSTIATPPSNVIIPTRKSRASTISSADAPRRNTGLHYKKPSLSTICHLPSMDENLVTSNQETEKVMTPLSTKRRSKALSDALSSRRRSSTISGGPPPSFDGTSGEQQKTGKEESSKGHRRSRTRGGSVSAVRSVVEVDRDLQLQRSRPSSSILYQAQDVVDMERHTPTMNSSVFSSRASPLQALDMRRSITDPGSSSPPVDSLDWSSYIDEGYNLSPISANFSASNLSYPSMSRTSSQATTVSNGESMARTASKGSNSSCSTQERSMASSPFRPHSRSSYEPTGVDWLDEELACASSDEEDLLLDSVSFPRPRSRIEPKPEDRKSPNQDSKRLPPSMPLPTLLVNKQVVNQESSSPNLSFMTPPSSPNPDESSSSTIQLQSKRSSLSQVVAQAVTSVETETPSHQQLTAAQRYARYASGEAVKTKVEFEDPIQRLALQSACQAVFGDAHGSSLVSRRSKKKIAPLSALEIHSQKSLPATPNEVSPTSATPIPALQIDFASTQPPLSDSASLFSGDEEGETVPQLTRRDGPSTRPDTADSSGSESLSVSSSNYNPGWCRASFSTDASSLLGSPRSPSSALPLLPQGGEAMIKSASADVSQTFTPMRPPRSPRRGSFDALTQATSTFIPTSGSSKPLPNPKSTTVSEVKPNAAPSLPPLRPSSTFSPEIKLPTSPKRKGSKKKPRPMAPIRMTSLENAVAVAPSSDQHQEPSSSLLGGWLSQDDVPLDGRVSPCNGNGAIFESLEEESDSDSDSGEESWWSGEEEDEEGAQKNFKDFEAFLGGDDDEMSNQQYVRGGNRSSQKLSATSQDSTRLRSSSNTTPAPKLSAAAAKRLGLSMDGTVPSTIAGRREQSKERKTSIPSYPASPTSSNPSRISTAFPPFPGTDSNFSDKNYFKGKSTSPPSKNSHPGGASKMRRFMARNNKEIQPSSNAFDRPASSMSFRDRFDSNVTASSDASAMDRVSLGFYGTRLSTDLLNHPQHVETTSQPSKIQKNQSSFLGLRARSSQIDLELSEADSATSSSSNLEVPSDQPRLKNKLSTGSFGFSKSNNSQTNVTSSAEPNLEGKKRFASIKIKKGSNKDPNSIFYKVWA